MTNRGQKEVFGLFSRGMPPQLPVQPEPCQMNTHESREKQKQRKKQGWPGLLSSLQPAAVSKEDHSTRLVALSEQKRKATHISLIFLLPSPKLNSIKEYKCAMSVCVGSQMPNVK